MVKDLLDAEKELNPRVEWRNRINYVAKIPKREINEMKIQRSVKTEIKEESKYPIVPQLKTISSYCSLILIL